jgi:ribosomal 50S subunit-recycling heat shock protein
LAQAAVATGRVRLNETRQDKPGHAVKPREVLTLGKGAQVMAVRILALAQSQRSAFRSPNLYEILA